MARVLLRLRLRLLGNTLQLGAQQALGFVLGSLFGGFFALLTAAVFTASSRDAGWTDVVITGLAVLWVGWLVLPAVSFNADTTLDPRRFAVFPLTTRQLVPGLLVAALVGIGPVVSLIAVSGIVIGASELGGVVAGLVAGVAVVGAVVSCVAWSRAMLAVASDLLASRRGRELAASIAFLAMMVIVFGPQLLTGITFRPDLGGLSDIAALAVWTPAGLAGGAIAAALDGHLGVAALYLGGVVLGIGIAVTIWAVALARTQRVSPHHATSSRRDAGSLFPRPLAFLPRNRITAVAVRFLRTLLRDTRVRMQVLSLTWIIVPLFVVSAGAIPGPDAPLYASYLVIPFGLLVANQYGLDGPALWQHELAGEGSAQDLLGRGLAVSLLGLPLAAIASIALAATFDAWATVPLALLLSAAVLLVLLGVSNVAAALVPYPIPEDPSNIFRGWDLGSRLRAGLHGVRRHPRACAARTPGDAADDAHHGDGPASGLRALRAHVRGRAADRRHGDRGLPGARPRSGAAGGDRSPGRVSRETPDVAARPRVTGAVRRLPGAR